jgi:hypothetical protein
MNNLKMLFVFILILGCSHVAHAGDFLPDEPEVGRDSSVPYQAMDSYSQALGTWKTAEDINKWVAGSFVYDRARAIELSSNRRINNKRIFIYHPSELFEIKAGVCVDLARFGVETLKIINPNIAPKYLMIKFKPIQIHGNTFRLHWLVSFEKDGKKYFFCDSKRPGYIAGPYDRTQVFIREYEQYRACKIVAHRELESYKRTRKHKSAKKKHKKVPTGERSPSAKIVPANSNY